MPPPGLPGPTPVPDAPIPPPPGSTTLVSRRVGGGFPNSSSAEPSISADGRYVAFASSGSNLVAAPPGTAPVPAVYVRDRQKGKTSRLPLPPGFAGGGSAREPSISADGSVVAFTYQAPAGFTSVGSIVLAWDRRTGKTEVVSRNSKGSPAGGSREPSVSANGRFVAFTSDNQDIVAGDNDNADVFRYDRRTRQTRPISVGFSGNLTSSTNSAPSISADGNLVAFVSDGGDVIVPTNTGNGTQVYLRDVRAGKTEQVSVALDGPPNGASGAPAVSGDGNAIAFESAATNLARNDSNEAPDVFLRDRGAGTTVLVSATPDGQSGGGLSRLPSISVDGRMVAFQSTAPDLTGATGARLGARLAASIQTPLTEVYERDVVADETILVSVARNGGPGGSPSLQSTVGGNGRFVAFASLAPTLVAGDKLGFADVFLRDFPPVPRLVPPAIAFGSLAVGSPAPPAAATLRNDGWGPLAVRAATIGGAARTDYRVLADGCNGRSLHLDEACTVTVSFTPSAPGGRPATLAVPYAFAGSPRTSRLSGSGKQATVFSGRLTIDPKVGPPGIVVIATGTGFAPGSKVRLTWSVGETPTLPIVQVDASGRFRKQVLVFHNDLTGPRALLATPLGGGKPASATMLVIRPSVVPPGFLIIRRLIDLPLVLVIRG